MSLQAYAEGVVALPNVLEAHRNAREALARYIDDVAAANDAAAAVRLLTAAESPLTARTCLVAAALGLAACRSERQASAAADTPPSEQTVGGVERQSPRSSPSRRWCAPSAP